MLSSIAGTMKFMRCRVPFPGGENCGIFVYGRWSVVVCRGGIISTLNRRNSSRFGSAAVDLMRIACRSAECVIRPSDIHLTAERRPLPIQAIRSTAWLLSGMTGSVAGELTLSHGRLVFETDDGRRLLDAAQGEISSVKFPWYYFGGGMKLRIGTNKYRLSFARPGNLPEEFGEHAGDIRSARRSGAEWKSALAASITHR